MRWSERAPATGPRSLSLPPFPCKLRSPSVRVAHLVLVRPMQRKIIARILRALLFALLLASPNLFAQGAYTQKMFRSALGDEVIAVSSYSYVLITVHEPHSSSQRVVAISVPSLLDAVSAEHRLKGSHPWAEAIQIALNQPGRSFSFSNPKARRLAQPTYTPEILQSMRRALSIYPRSVLLKALKTRNRQPIDVDALYDGAKRGDQMGAYEDAVAHVYLEKGILVGHLSYSGGLFVAED
jgi:hypothetical protein